MYCVISANSIELLVEKHIHNYFPGSPKDVFSQGNIRQL